MILKKDNVFYNKVNYLFQLSRCKNFVKLSKCFLTSNNKNPLSPNSEPNTINKFTRNQITKMLDNKENIIKQQVKGGGPGGQHVNKTSSTVFLKDKQTNISVKVSNSRDSVVNSGIAKKRLIDKLDLHYNGEESKIAKKIEKIKKQKNRRKERSAAKHNSEKNSTTNLKK